MAYNTVAIRRDVNNDPAPQYYNPTTGEYEVLQGANGAARHILYGADGNPVSTTDNKLAVRASEIETQLTTIQGYIDGLEASLGTATADPAANTVLARLKTLATLIGEVQAAPTTNTILARLKSVADKIDAITVGTTPAVTQLSGSLIDLRGLAANKPTANSVNPGVTYWSVDVDPNADAIEVSDGMNWTVMM
ncbi:MAG TPA: hypothetical protein VN441_16290 [Syntrophomonas sp.]|nr:hypothetical protein [Syntrophomonas sp.]